MAKQALDKDLPCGVLLIDKPAGITSADVIRVIKRNFPVWKFKIGHAGTLDPFATGVLVVLVGRATRLVPFLHEGWKSYEGRILFGTVTDTDDVTGKILHKVKPNALYVQGIQNEAKSLCGDIQQVPPQYSAVKVDGKRAYDLARQGEQVELQAKHVHIFHFEITHAVSEVEYAFEVRCSGGTYIRSLARDLGERLACGACLSSLTRTGVQPFLIQESHSLDKLGVNMLLPWWEACRELPKVSLPTEMVNSLLLGRQDVLENLEDDLLSPEHLRFPFLVYADAQSSMPLGLLAKNEKNDWEIAVNFGFPS